MSKHKRSAGRPPLDPRDRRSARREIALRPGEARLLDAAAESVGQSFSAWARDVLLAAVKRLGLFNP